MLCTTGIWIDVYSVPTFALLGSWCSWILQILETMWAIHIRWLRCVWPMWTYFFGQFCVCTVGCEPLEYVVLYDWPPWASADEVVTSSTAVAQHSQGQSKPLTHYALQGHTSHGRTLATVLALWIQGVCAMQTAAGSPGKLFIFSFFGGSPDSSGCPGGSVQIKVQIQSNRGLRVWSLSRAQIRMWGDDDH